MSDLLARIAADVAATPYVTTDGRGGAGPCDCPGCYVHGCGYCARIGCVRHFADLRPR